MCNILLCCVCIVLVLNLTTAEESVPLSKLVPKLELGSNGYLTPESKAYKLFLWLPNGGSRSETVTFDKDPETGVEALQVEGQSTLRFENSDAFLDIQYVAGRKGYNVKYKYIKHHFDILSLSPSALKSITG